MKIYKILGKRGRVTIPYEARVMMGCEPNDVISFELRDDKTVVIRNEQMCYTCRQEEKANAISLQDVLDELPMEAKRDALIYLSMQLALNRRDEGDQQ